MLFLGEEIAGTARHAIRVKSLDTNRPTITRIVRQLVERAKAGDDVMGAFHWNLPAVLGLCLALLLVQLLPCPASAYPSHQGEC